VSFEITKVADDVEDIQIAYGVDNLRRRRLRARRETGWVTRQAVTTARDSDLNTSNQAGGDAWQPNVVGETPWPTIDFQSDAVPRTFQQRQPGSGALPEAAQRDDRARGGRGSRASAGPAPVLERRR
jgi:hypothetical protein